MIRADPGWYAVRCKMDEKDGLVVSAAIHEDELFRRPTAHPPSPPF